MAIGWGKSFEEQLEEANQRASEKLAPRIPSEDRVRRQRLESLNLSRSRVEQQLESGSASPSCELMRALQAIEKEAEAVYAETSGTES